MPVFAFAGPGILTRGTGEGATIAPLNNVAAYTPDVGLCREPIVTGRQLNHAILWSCFAYYLLTGIYPALQRRLQRRLRSDRLRANLRLCRIRSRRKRNLETQAYHTPFALCL